MISTTEEMVDKMLQVYSNTPTSINWALRFNTEVLEPARKLAGLKTQAQMAAEAIEDLLDDTLIERGMRELDDMWERHVNLRATS